MDVLSTPWAIPPGAEWGAKVAPERGVAVRYLGRHLSGVAIGLAVF